MKELDAQVLNSSMQTLSLLLHCPGFSVLLMKVVTEQTPQDLNIHWMCLQKLPTITLCASANAMGQRGWGRSCLPFWPSFFLLSPSAQLVFIYLASC